MTSCRCLNSDFSRILMLSRFLNVPGWLNLSSGRIITRNQLQQHAACCRERVKNDLLCKLGFFSTSVEVHKCELARGLFPVGKCRVLDQFPRQLAPGDDCVIESCLFHVRVHQIRSLSLFTCNARTIRVAFPRGETPSFFVIGCCWVFFGGGCVQCFRVVSIPSAVMPTLLRQMNIGSFTCAQNIWVRVAQTMGDSAQTSLHNS